MSEEGARPEPSPPLPPRYGLALAVLTGLFQGTALLFLVALGFPFGIGLVGMAALLAYGAAFALCVPRIAQPPTLGLALLRPPRLAWIAALMLVWALLLSSEIDNLVKLVIPVPEAMQAPDRALELHVRDVFGSNGARARHGAAHQRLGARFGVLSPKPS